MRLSEYAAKYINVNLKKVRVTMNKNSFIKLMTIIFSFTLILFLLSCTTQIQDSDNGDTAHFTGALAFSNFNELPTEMLSLISY